MVGENHRLVVIVSLLVVVVAIVSVEQLGDAQEKNNNWLASMEDRQLLSGVLLFLAASTCCSVVSSAKGSKLHCGCSLNEDRFYTLDITCAKQKEGEGGVGCTKEEKPRMPKGYRYVPGYGLYRMYRTVQHWTKARDFCKQDGARLAIPRDASIASTLWDMFKFDVYVGISDMASEGVFIGVDGKLPPYINWSPGEPNGDRKDNCVALYKGGFMKDVYCGRGWYFICERPYTAALPDGYVYLDNYGFFKIHTDKATFADAEGVCQAEGGHLLLLETYEEAEAVALFVKRDGRRLNEIWTGLNDTQTEGKFMTYSGRSIDELEYRNWNYGEPNDDHDGEDCAVFNEHGALNDERCYMKFNFICEFPAP